VDYYKMAYNFAIKEIYSYRSITGEWISPSDLKRSFTSEKSISKLYGKDCDSIATVTAISNAHWKASKAARKECEQPRSSDLEGKDYYKTRVRVFLSDGVVDEVKIPKIGRI